MTVGSVSLGRGKSRVSKSESATKKKRERKEGKHEFNASGFTSSSTLLGKQPKGFLTPSVRHGKTTRMATMFYEKPGNSRLPIWVVRQCHLPNVKK
jgi:hypothetical protein